MSEFVSRPEFDGAVESIRRELQTMGENLGRQLAQIQKQLTDMSRTNSEESRKVAALEVRVEGLEEWKEGELSTKRALTVGLLVSLAAHAFQILTKR